MNPEERQVDEEGEDDEANDAVEEVLIDVLLGGKRCALSGERLAHDGVTSLDIHDPPQVPDDGRTNGHEGEQADHLAPQSARERGTRRKEPEPPLRGEFAVSLLVEFDIGEQRQRHEQDQSAVKEDQSSLGDMSVVFRQSNDRYPRRSCSPNKMSEAENAAIATGYPDSRMMAYTRGTVTAPKIAQKLLIPTYGTFAVK